MKINHKCNMCGKVHAEIPEKAQSQFNDDMGVMVYFWQCSCQSTMCKIVRPVNPPLSKIIKATA